MGIGCFEIEEEAHWHAESLPGRMAGRLQIYDKRGLQRRPVVYVNWYGAVAYCNCLTEKHGLGADQCCYGGYKDTGVDMWAVDGANYNSDSTCRRK
ncbi:MAG: hypothetical protein AB2L14_10425 [Candidatus Xenobiia bacterium LiM19]